MPTMTSWAAMMHALRALMSAPGWALASTCPAMGSIAALPSATSSPETATSARLARSASTTSPAGICVHVGFHRSRIGYEVVRC